MSLGETIKKLAQASEDNATPTAYLYGTAIQADPLQVLVDSRFELDEAFLVVPDHIRAGGIAAGDKLILLRNRGGGEYLILGKVGNNGNAGTD